MFYYIGIRGHRGAGKNTISYLLGHTIDYYTNHQSWNNFTNYWNDILPNIWKDDFCGVDDLQNVYFESYADTLKAMIHSLINIPMNWMYDDYLKDNVWINMKDFSYVKRNNKLDPAPNNIITNTELFNLRYNEIDTEVRPKTFREDLYISLRDFINYFGFTMQSFFGLNVWVKSLDRNKLDVEKFYAGSNKTIYKIFIDVKYPSEVSYIKNNNGIIVKVVRPDNIKEDTDVSNELDFDSRVDYEVNNDLETLKDTLCKIAEEIVNKNEKS